MSGRPPRNPLDLQILRRMMTNQLMEGISSNRVQASIAPTTRMDPAKAEFLGKTLGEIQDCRDQAHEEAVNANKVIKDVATEKRSIRDRIAEMKAKIEHKKYLLDKVTNEKQFKGKHHEEVFRMEGESAVRSQQATRTLKEDTKNQLGELYRLRDKLLSAEPRGGATIAPQVKLRIEERMGTTEAQIDREIEDNHRLAANLEENLAHADRASDGQNIRIEETKYALGEIKRESEELDKDIEREIDAKNADINDTTTALKDTLREKQELKWRIGSLESEVNNLEYQKSKLEIEVQVRSLKDNKYDVIDKLNRRMEDAKYNEQHIRDLCSHAKDISIDVGFIERMDIEGDRQYRLRQLQDDLAYKKKNEEQTKSEIRALNDRLRTIGEVNIESKSFHYEENYSHVLQDLNIGYTDIVQSVKDHLSANAAILRKEKEIKEMEARIALIDLDALDEEYNRLRIQYDRDSEILRDLEERYSLIHDRLIRLRARLRELNDLIRTLEDRYESARYEVEDAERKYRLIKVPKKIEYVVNERVEDVLIRKKYMTPGETISEKQYAQERKSRIVRNVNGEKFYKPDAEELEHWIPQGSRVRFISEGNSGYYSYGTHKVSFIRGNDDELYVDDNGEVMQIDKFLEFWEPEERDNARRTKVGNMEGRGIDGEEMDAEVGDELEGRRFGQMGGRKR